MVFVFLFPPRCCLFQRQRVEANLHVVNASRIYAIKNVDKVCHIEDPHVLESHAVVGNRRIGIAVDVSCRAREPTGDIGKKVASIPKTIERIVGVDATLALWGIRFPDIEVLVDPAPDFPKRKTK